LIGLVFYSGDSMNSDLQAQIIDMEERFRQAMLQADVRVLDELIAPELLFTNLFGQIVSKAEDLAGFQAGILRLKELTPSDQRIQLHPDFAVVSVRMHLVGSYQGAPIDEYIRYTRVWSISSNGSLQITAGHSSKVQAS
jgi:ketosteroid isomerase-like protein